MKRQNERRLVENEAIFKYINTDVDDFLHDIGAQHIALVPFYCECSNLRCTQRIEVSPAEYEKIHETKRRFMLVIGHENTQIENVITRNRGYVIVEKHIEPPTDAQVARRLKDIKV